MSKLKPQILLLLATVAFSGCESVRENVNFEMKAEQEKLEPHEQRREELRDLAQPK
jgi:hypothetical protein